MTEITAAGRPDLSELESLLAVRIRSDPSGHFDDLVAFADLQELSRTSVVSAILFAEIANRWRFDENTLAAARDVLDFWLDETEPVKSSWAWAAISTRRAELDEYSWYDTHAGDSIERSRTSLVDVHSRRPDWARPVLLLNELAAARQEWRASVEWCEQLVRLDPGDETNVPPDVVAIESFTSGKYFWTIENAREALESARARYAERMPPTDRGHSI